MRKRTDFKMNVWSTEHINYLKENYQKLTYKEISLSLNRSEKSISAKVTALNLVKDKINIKRKSIVNSNWSEKDIEFLKLYYKEKEDRELSIILNKTIRSIGAKRNRLGLNKDIIRQTNIICNYCNKEIIRKNSLVRENLNFCNLNCKLEYNKELHTVKCKECNKIFIKTKLKQIFCSVECNSKHSQKRVLLNCFYCNKEIERINIRVSINNNNFCSTQCRYDYQKSVTKRINHTCTNCNKEFIANTCDKRRFCSYNCFRLFTGPTSLEIFGNKLLDDLNINYKTQYQIYKYYADVYIPEYNLVIEWQGDYWHGHKNIIKRIGITRDMKLNMAKDIRKFKYLKDNNYNLLTFWESDVYHNTDNVINEIKKYIK